MSLGDEFQVTLPSNVKSCSRNKPPEFETQLSKSLELPGEWDVALIDLTYPHNWVNLDKEYYLMVLTALAENEQHSPSRNTGQPKEIEESIRLESGLDEYKYRAYIPVQAGNYTPNELVKKVTQLIDYHSGARENVMTFGENARKIIIKPIKSFVLACVADHSLFQIMGLGKQVTKTQSSLRKTIEYIKFEENENVIAGQCPTLNRLTNMFVYTDICELSLIGDTQAPLLGYLPIQSKFGEQGYWCFNPPYYVKVKENHITNITIKICTDTGEVFPIEDGKVICRLNFKRRGFFR